MLRSEAAIPGHNRPPVPPHLVPWVAVDEYGLDCERLVGDHQGAVTISDGGNNWIGVEMPPHPMPNKIWAHGNLVPVSQVVDGLQPLRQSKCWKVDSGKDTS